MTPAETVDVTRRDFLKGGSLAAVMAWMGGTELRAQALGDSSQAVQASSQKVGVGVVGLGLWGREMVSTLSRIASARVAVVCDTYASSRKRAQTLVPGADAVDDYRKLLEAKEVQAVVIATPTHRHAEVALASMAAGKHVYCEAPLASTIEDARAIVGEALRVTPQQVFQAGLQFRSDPLRHLVAGFFKAGTAGQPVMGRAQWHKKTSWRHAAPSPERETELNWRLDPGKSLGLVGEIGVHHLDAASWMFGARPEAVSGRGVIRHWRQDGRKVPDTVHWTVEFAEGLQSAGTLTLASSFDAESELFFGTDATVLFRGGRGWMFREADAPLLGWEAHARKETFHRETGLVLVANASKQAAVAGDAGSGSPPEAVVTPLQHALEAFVGSVADVESARADFIGAYGAGEGAALTQHLRRIPRRPGAGPQEGFESTVVAIKASEAVLAGGRIALRPEWFELG